MKYNRLSKYRIKKIIECFSMDLTATETSQLLSINRNTINKYHNCFKEKILKYSLSEQVREYGEFELDESYFGAKRIRGKRGRGAAGKTPVFGLLKRDGKVFVSIVKQCSREELLPIIQGNILEGSTIHTDGWKAYDGLILNGYNHYRVYHSKNEFVRDKSHVNGIESFWSFAKRRLAKFNGISDGNFVLHLKETEFRFNHKNCDIFAILVKIFFYKTKDDSLDPKILRQFFQKGTNSCLISDYEISKIQQQINDRPIKVLNLEYYK